ncbi:hypothetical protein CIG75_16195 [Tumebacillus algifaecis]|uniref:Uncharacterized protein n=1 Tax=Tumebacillus algifaecis TaxID=1214604 RepID=A0A223D4I3_9BACL|nr:hypothetical protein [Tumebacillus algifaecis]ASS76336.1 hypothetical protein CIG75_16195 [Tumebacillus algifaecis]
MFITYALSIGCAVAMLGLFIEWAGQRNWSKRRKMWGSLILTIGAMGIGPITAQLAGPLPIAAACCCMTLALSLRGYHTAPTERSLQEVSGEPSTTQTIPVAEQTFTSSEPIFGQAEAFEEAPQVQADVFVHVEEEAPQVQADVFVHVEEETPQVQADALVHEEEEAPQVQADALVHEEEETPQVQADALVHEEEETPQVQADALVHEEEEAPQVQADALVHEEEETPQVQVNVLVNEEEKTPQVQADALVHEEEEAPQVQVNVLVHEEEETPLVQADVLVHDEETPQMQTDVAEQKALERPPLADEELSAWLNLQIATGYEAKGNAQWERAVTAFDAAVAVCTDQELKDMLKEELQACLAQLPESMKDKLQEAS